MFPTSDRNRYEPTVSNFMMTFHKAAFVGVFPYWQAWTRCPPGVEYLGIWPRVGAYPFKKVEDQRFNSVGHSRPYGNRRPVRAYATPSPASAEALEPDSGLA